ncbi:hypothetical protein B0H19DRAFT_480708 [Mycena capillaripes]|nr:hypothetical protein B0H19DRAFT_480708 [Mycena capillaripes]
MCSFPHRIHGFPRLPRWPSPAQPHSVSRRLPLSRGLNNLSRSLSYHLHHHSHSLHLRPPFPIAPSHSSPPGTPCPGRTYTTAGVPSARHGRSSSRACHLLPLRSLRRPRRSPTLNPQKHDAQRQRRLQHLQHRCLRHLAAHCDLPRGIPTSGAPRFRLSRTTPYRTWIRDSTRSGVLQCEIAAHAQWEDTPQRALAAIRGHGCA